MELTMKVSREALERFWHSWSPTGLALATWVTLSTIFAFLPLWASASLSVKWNPDIKGPWRFLPLWDLVLVLHYLYTLGISGSPASKRPMLMKKGRFRTQPQTSWTMETRRRPVSPAPDDAPAHLRWTVTHLLLCCLQAYG